MVGWHHHSTDINLSKLPEILEDREAWRAAVHGGRKEWDMTEQLNNILTYILLPVPKVSASLSWSRL